VPAAIQQMAEDRAAARAAKDWTRADELRDAIAKAGFAVEDTPEGPIVRRT
jgi:cysteinyl-tRNA synthetase